MSLQLSTAAFANGEHIPVRYTCDGDKLSPPLFWTGAPPDTETFALIAEDPDAPSGIFTHWVVFNLPASLQHLSEGVEPTERLDVGGAQGRNDFGELGYGPPCPPHGDAPHRYHFTLYALDTTLQLPPGATKQQVLDALQDHILDQSRIYGSYRRHG